METIDVFIPGVPKGQPRPRAFAFRGQARVYNPSSAEGWKSQMAMAIKEVLPTDPMEGPICVDLTFFMPRPKNHYRTGKHAGELKPGAPEFHTGKPDRDNLDKAVLDCLKTLGLFRDDAQVCAGQIVKVYEDGRGPGCRLQVRAVSILPERISA